MSIFRLSLRARNNLAAAMAGLIDRGDGPGVIEFYAGEQPASVDIAPARPRRLACLAFARPAFSRAENGAVAAVALAPCDALATGRAAWARISDGDGNALFDVDVGGANSGAGLTINTTQLVANGPVVIDDFILRMPAG